MTLVLDDTALTLVSVSASVSGSVSASVSTSVSASVSGLLLNETKSIIKNTSYGLMCDLAFELLGSYA